MKKFIMIFALLIVSVMSYAQVLKSETTRPLMGAEIVRHCSSFDIEGIKYEDVTVTLKSNEPDYIFVTNSKVKVTVTDANGLKVWSKSFKKAYLYVFSSGQTHVGRPKFTQLFIDKSNYSKDWIGIVREKEGVY